MPDLRIQIKSGSLVSVELIDLAEDLYSDFLYFLGKAISAYETDDSLHRRHLRAALLLLFCYHEARLNCYVAHLLVSGGSTQSKAESKLSKLNAQKKHQIVEGAYSPNHSSRAKALALKIREMKVKRNSMSHFYQGDLQLLQVISFHAVGEAALNILEWQSLVDASLGFLPDDTDIRLRKFRAFRATLHSHHLDLDGTANE